MGTWLPLIVPHFFANAFNVFLLRQYFLTIPKELDEAATIDGAGPFRSLWSVLLPQMKAPIVAVSLFHFYFAWNDFFEPLIYLSARPELQPISVGLRTFNTLYDEAPSLIQSGAMLALDHPGHGVPLRPAGFPQGHRSLRRPEIAVRQEKGSSEPE